MAVAVDRMARLHELGTARTRRYSEVAQCFGSYDSSLRAFLARCTGSHHDAEDLAQEVYLRLARMDGLSHVRSRKAFVYRTAMNLLRDRSRRMYTRVQRAAVCSDELELPDIGSEPSGELESTQLLAAIERVMAALKPATRLAFVLHRVQDWSHAQVAAHMGVSTSMVEKHVSAAAARLREAGVGVK